MILANTVRRLQSVSILTNVAQTVKKTVIKEATVYTPCCMTRFAFVTWINKQQTRF